MSKHQDRIQKAKEKIVQHYNKHGKQTHHLDPDAIIEKLNAEYASEEALSMAGLKELVEFPMPDLLARELLLSWRELNRENITVIVDTSAEAEAARLSTDGLVDKYDPDLQPDAYGKRLAEIASSYTNNREKSPKFLIFIDTENTPLTLDKDLTKQELAHLKGVGAGRDIAIYNDVSHETFAVGSRPLEYADQSPWNPDEILFNGESNAGVKWLDLPLETRQLIYIVSASAKNPAYQYSQHDKDLQARATYREQELFDELKSALDKAEKKARHENRGADEVRALGEKASFTAAVKIFPYGAAFFRDLERQGQLPSMKTPVGGGTGTPTTGGGSGTGGS